MDKQQEIHEALAGIRVYGFDLDPEKDYKGNTIPPRWLVMIPITETDRKNYFGIREKQKQIDEALTPTPGAPAAPGPDLREALLLLLDHVDYTAGACGLAEPVGGVLPREIINIARARLRGDG